MLWHQFRTNDARIAHKWKHFFPIYERHFSPFRNRSNVIWEIGVSFGGSVQAWKQYFGPHATIIGIDIDPQCKECEEDQIFIRTGSQSDTKFLQSIVEEFGMPEVILDDGSHQMKDMHATFYHMYPQMPANSVYMVEDLHTCYWPELGGAMRSPESFMETCKDLVDELNAYHTRGAIQPNVFTDATNAICFYDSVVAFERKQRPKNLVSEHTGKIGFTENK